MVFQRWLHDSWRRRFKASHLSCTSHARHQCQAAVKVPGSFRPAAGSEHLYSHCNFAESLVETAPKSLRHSCRSELTRQGISLECVTYDLYRAHVARQAGRTFLPASLCRHRVRTISSSPLGDGWRMVSEDSRDGSRVFPAGFPAWRLVRHPPSDCYCSLPRCTGGVRQE